MPDYYFELKQQQVAAMGAAAEVLDDLVDELEGLTGRRYEPLERYRLDDAARAIVLMGSSAGTAKDVVDELRARHQPVGLLRIGSFRPFPAQALRDALHSVSDVAVLDRADSPGGTPPLFAEVAAAMHHGRSRVRSVVYGLGGRELHPDDIETVFDSLHQRADAAPTYLGLRSRG
jgi:pyruvate ferredoxin oxidoreductase alpha subunit